MKNLVILFTFLFLTSCGADLLNSRSPSSEGTSSEKSCICTFEFNPVCSAGVTYDNPCIAKCNGAQSFSNGKCECNESSGSVCATPPMPTCAPGMMCSQVMPQAKTYSNECEMIKAKASFVKKGSCN
jgi:hypothetical protein